MSGLWVVNSANPDDDHAFPVALQLSADRIRLNATAARELADALIAAADHQGHEGDMKQADCQFCDAEFEAEARKWGQRFGVLDSDGNETGKRLRVPHVGDPDAPVYDSTCSACGDGHEVFPADGRCVPNCETCEIAHADGDMTPCVLDRLSHASDSRREAL